jgi:adenylosuccinate lyase
MIPRYSPEDVARIWEDSHRYSLWMSVELAACKSMEHRGIVPNGTTELVRERTSILDSGHISRIEKTTRHDFIAFLTYIEELVGEPARWIHRGMTSSDVVDTAFSLQIREASRLILNRVSRLIIALGRRSFQESATPMIGRSHGMHAEPTTVGLILAGHRAELMRANDRFAKAVDEVSVGKLSGVVGTYAHFPPEVEIETIMTLGLRPESVSTQVVARDRYAVWIQSLIFIACAIERLALTVRHWQRTEVGEAEEGFGPGQKGSSAMPHKRNPIISENLCGLARLMRSYSGPVMEDISLWHERDISHSSVERIIMPDASCVLAYMLDRSIDLVNNLVFFPDRMIRNISMSQGRIFSEYVLLALTDAGFPRQESYDAVQRCAMASWTENRSFQDLLASDPYVGLKIGVKLNEIFDLSKITAHIPTLVQRALSKSNG